MAKLIYSAIASLDGYVADESGNFEWAAPGEDVHRFVNDLERDVGTYLYGRRMYEVMAAWETADALPEQTAATADFSRRSGRRRTRSSIRRHWLRRRLLLVGGGTKALPDRLRLELELLEESRFDSGVVYLHYRCDG